MPRKSKITQAPPAAVKETLERLGRHIRRKVSAKLTAGLFHASQGLDSNNFSEISHLRKRFSWNIIFFMTHMTCHRNSGVGIVFHEHKDQSQFFRPGHGISGKTAS